METNHGRHTVKKTAELSGVSRSAYYKWFKAGFSNSQVDPDAGLIRLIRGIVIKRKYRYGSPRVKKELFRKHGLRVSRKKTARILREHGLNARRMKKYTATTDSKHSYPVCENILNRGFFAAKPGQKWVSGITYLRELNGWVYLTVVIDLYGRKATGWPLSGNLETVNTTIPAFEMAVKNRAAEKGLIFHSGRGVQYCAYSFRDVICKHIPAVQQSMSRKANCWGNACAESFFKTLKPEEEKTSGEFSAGQVRRAVFFYIESYYNRERLHSVLGYVAPVEYNSSNIAA